MTARGRAKTPATVATIEGDVFEHTDRDEDVNSPIPINGTRIATPGRLRRQLHHGGHDCPLVVSWWRAALRAAKAVVSTSRLPNSLVAADMIMARTVGRPWWDANPPIYLVGVPISLSASERTGRCWAGVGGAAESGAKQDGNNDDRSSAERGPSRTGAARRAAPRLWTVFLTGQFPNGFRNPAKRRHMDEGAPPVCQPHSPTTGRSTRVGTWRRIWVGSCGSTRVGCCGSRLTSRASGLPAAVAGFAVTVAE